MIKDEELNGLFKVESAEHIQRLGASLLSLEKAPGDVDILDSMMRDAHSLKGAARMVEALGVETASHAYEDLLRAAMKGDVILSADDIDLMSWTLDVLKDLINEEVTGTPAKILASDAEARLHSVLSIEKNEDLKPPPNARKKTKPQIEKLVEGEIVSPKAPSSVLKQASEISPSSSEAYSIDTVRVQTRKLDALMTQAGELVVTKGRISQVLAAVDQVSATIEDWGRELAKIRMTISRPSFSSERGGGRGNDNILALHERQRLRLEQVRGQMSHLRSTASGSHAQLEAVTNELMDGISDIRLLPLSILFDLFPRMVRDLARQNGKDVSLSIEGADTRADKRILEEMKDPVMHLLRNAIDHGIESPAERKRKGKPSQGNVWLRARQTQNSIEIEVADDGAGLDLEAIAKVAKKQGVQGGGPDGEMTPEQIHAAVLAPGVSTSGFVTEISGRGVGLDVVRSKVERLKGELHITSDPGTGFTMRIRLPISLAVHRVLLVRVGEHMYGLPVEAVETSFLVDEGDIVPMEGHSTLLINGRPLSVALLSNILEMPLARNA
ncbi:MAG: ATP-binding protein, partial [Rhodospirillales bacterium]|nr:ATP-binding protein [Rhodospirillales bacterium]